jgi:hypothetical protein
MSRVTTSVSVFKLVCCRYSIHHRSEGYRVDLGRCLGQLIRRGARAVIRLAMNACKGVLRLLLRPCTDGANRPRIRRIRCTEHIILYPRVGTLSD